MELLTRQLWKIAVSILLLLCLAGGAAAAPPPGSGPPGESEELPLNITADRLEVEQNEQVISFLHNVVARYKDMILYADILKIFYQTKAAAPGAPAAGGTAASRRSPETAAGAASPQPAPASPLGAAGLEKISRIEALGKVRMVQGDRVATGDKAIYLAAEEKLVLTGNPQLWRGDNSLRGHEIVFYLKDNRAVVTGAPEKRVEAVIHPSQKVQLPGRQQTPAPGRGQ
jgi:lipopolysaccharide export system protein LptA